MATLTVRGRAGDEESAEGACEEHVGVEASVVGKREWVVFGKEWRSSVKSEVV